MSSDSVTRLPRREVYNRNLVIVNLIGLVLSAYAHHVGVAKKAEADYKAFCDMSEVMSCSRVLTSSYSSGFGILGKLFGETSALNFTNSTMGMFLYLSLIILSLSKSLCATKVHFYLAFLSNIASVYLMVVLFFILRDFCLVCSSTYAVNAVNLFLVNEKLKLLKRRSQKKKE